MIAMGMINKLLGFFHKGYPKVAVFRGSPEEDRTWISEALSEIDRHDWRIPDELWKKLYTPEELFQFTVNFPKECTIEKWYSYVTRLNLFRDCGAIKLTGLTTKPSITFSLSF